MVALAAQYVAYSLGGYINPNVSGDLSSHAWVIIPYASTAQLRPGEPELIRNWPVEAHGIEKEAARCSAFLDDLYERIHISPSTLALGNVVSTQSSDVYIWNAHLNVRSLSDIVNLAEGVEIDGPEPPVLFAGLQERVWTVSVTPEGAPTLDANITWLFSTAESVGLRITANRIIGWAFMPDWGAGIIETLASLTDLLQSESAVTQRRLLRQAPRRELSGPMYVEGRERQLLDMALFGWSDRVWALPIWPDIQLLQVDVGADADFIPCSTRWLDFRVGGLAMLRGEDAFTFETVEIQELLSTGLQLKRTTQLAWPAGSRLYPVRAAQLVEEPSLSKLTDRLIEAEVRFLIVEACDWPEWVPDTLYRGIPVWDRRPDDTDNLTHTAQRLRSTLDSGFAQPLVTDTAGRALQVLNQRHLDLGREARALIRSFIYGMHGRQRVVWVPSHMDDVTIVAPISALATTIDIAYIGYTRFSSGKPGRRDMRIELFDGRVFMRRVTGSVELVGQAERLGIDSVLGVELQPTEIARVSWMNLVRFDSDTQRIEHMTDSEGVAAWVTVFREERDDEF
ncbi:hypothetical protein [Stutzerimonas nitrititolerans]|uniref:hypothetical protein n=1 Tax=Stutzerimonas nitrititolerans TaxID=2482751 RepID=UPI002898BAC3|nr:hypothetical protein [Stutzerimonas nitrititolerans]